MIQLSLPELSAELVSKIRLFSNELAHNDNDRLWLNEFHNNTINAVNQNFVPFDHDIDAEIKEIYSGYFNNTIRPVIGVMRNVTRFTATMPCHCDRLRNIAINYYIDLGGDDVSTQFYDYTRTDDTTVSENISKDSVNLLDSYTFQRNKWYCYNVQQCHSVENIETTRIFLGLFLENNPTINEFMQEYSNLVIQ